MKSELSQAMSAAAHRFLSETRDLMLSFCATKKTPSIESGQHREKIGCVAGPIDNRRTENQCASAFVLTRPLSF